MNKWTPFFKWQKQSKTAYLHKAIHYSNVKTIYNITIKKSKQAAAQRYSKKTCKLRACRPAAATLLKMNSLLSFTSIFQRFRLLFRSTQLKEHLYMVTSENITQIEAKINKKCLFSGFPLSYSFDDIFNFQYTLCEEVLWLLLKNKETFPIYIFSFP